MNKKVKLSIPIIVGFLNVFLCYMFGMITIKYIKLFTPDVLLNTFETFEPFIIILYICICFISSISLYIYLKWNIYEVIE